MKKIYMILMVLASTLQVRAQHVYQIRADSVRIYNVCDTAELIIENRTRGVSGFLYNKGNGRTEFRRLRLESINGSQIAISGQDTLDISTLSGIGGIDTIYRDGDNIRYVKKGVPYTVHAPVPVTETLQSVMARGNTTTNTIQFNNATGNPSNGLLWSYNTDLWRIFVESPQDTPAGNMIFQSADNGTEGWIFRSSTLNGQGVVDVLSIAGDRFNYNGSEIWHAGNHLPGTSFSSTLTGATVPAAFHTNASGHVTGFTTRALIPADIGAASAGIPLQSVLSNGNTATNSITLGADGNATSYSLYMKRLLGGTNYTGSIGVGIDQTSLTMVMSGGGNDRRIYLPALSAAPLYSPDGGTTKYTMWHSGNMNPVQNQFASAQTGNAWVNGIFKANGEFRLSKEGSNTVSGGLRLEKTDGSRAANFQLTGDTHPGLAAWVTNSVGTWIKRMEISSEGVFSLSVVPAATTDVDKFIVQDGGILKSRTGAQLLSDIGAAPVSGGGSYIHNSVATQPSSNFWISGQGVTNGNFQVRKNGTAGVNGAFTLYNAAATGGVNFQLNEDTNPGLAIWVHSGSGWAKRMEILSTGEASITNGLYAPRALSNNSAGRFDIIGGAIGTGSVRGAQVGVFGGTHATTPGVISFYSGTGGGGSEQPERMRINAAGRILMGVSLPADDGGNTLQVNGGIRATSGFTTSGAEGLRLSNDGAYIAFYNTANNTRSGYLQFQAANGTILNTEINKGFYIRTNNIERFSIGSTGIVNISNIPALGTAATTYLVSNAGNISSRTPTQMLSDISAAPVSGSGNYIQNQLSTPQTANALINGIFRSTNQIQIYKNGSNTILDMLEVRNAAGTRGVNFQINGDANPGLALWITNPSGTWTKRMEILADGKTLMNGAVNDGTNTFQVNGSIASNASVLATSFYQSSLRSLKKNILPFTASALAILESAQVRTFQFKSDSTGKTNIGFIADEVPDEIAIPGRKGVDQASTVALLVKSVQELSSRNEELEQRVKKLEGLVTKLLNEKSAQNEN